MKVRMVRVLGAVGSALAAAALLAGGAWAADRPDDRGGLIGVGGAAVVAPTGVFERAVQRHLNAKGSKIVIPDVFERAVVRARADVVRPDDRGGVRGPGVLGTSGPSSGDTSRGSGIAWSGAALGATAGTFGVIVLGVLATLMLRHRRRVAVR
jgi:hypothetical protein